MNKYMLIFLLYIFIIIWFVKVQSIHKSPTVNFHFLSIIFIISSHLVKCV